MAIMFFLDMFI